MKFPYYGVRLLLIISFLVHLASSRAISCPESICQGQKLDSYGYRRSLGWLGNWGSVSHIQKRAGTKSPGSPNVVGSPGSNSNSPQASPGGSIPGLVLDRPLPSAPSAKAPGLTIPPKTQEPTQTVSESTASATETQTPTVSTEGLANPTATGGSSPNPDNNAPNAGPSGDNNPDAGGIGDAPTDPAENNSVQDFIQQVRSEDQQVDWKLRNRYMKRLVDNLASPPKQEVDLGKFADYSLDRKHIDDILANSQNAPGHDQLRDMFDELGMQISREGGVSYLVAKDFDNHFDSAAQRWSYSSDGKAVFSDWAFAEFDAHPDSPGRPFFPEKSVHMLRSEEIEGGAELDLKKIEVVGRVNIANEPTTNTIASAFQLVNPTALDTDILRLQADSTDPAVQQAVDGILRTENGRGVLNMLAFFPEAYGMKTISEILLKREAKDGRKAQMLITLKPAEF